MSDAHSQDKSTLETATAQTTSEGTTLVQPDWWTDRARVPFTSDYEIIGEVARGGMGVVFKARHKQLDTQRALKIMLPGSSADRFLREARLLAKIRSRYVVAVHDFEVLADGCPMLVMEWVEGTDLAKAIRAQKGPMPEEQVLRWMRDVCKGMSAAADAHIIHRDLKPSNILIDMENQARVADFGLARGSVSTSGLSMHLDFMGTPHYMSPEQAESPRDVDVRADIYSFGATFYHALTGNKPFDGDTAFSILLKHKMEPLVAPRASNPHLTDHTSAILERCLAKAPGERFSSFADLLKVLQPDGRGVEAWGDDDDAKLARHLNRYRERRDVYLNRTSELSTPDVYEFPEGRTLQILRGNIVDQKVDALVSSDDELLSMGRMGQGVSVAIREAAGSEQMALEVRKYVPVRPGRVVVTSAGKLASRFVFHGVTLAFQDATVRWPSRDLIIEILNSCIFHADTLHVRSMALPLLGTGNGRFPKDVCLDAMFHRLAKSLLCELMSLQDVRIVLYG